MMTYLLGAGGNRLSMHSSDEPSAGRGLAASWPPRYSWRAENPEGSSLRDGYIKQGPLWAESADISAGPSRAQERRRLPNGPTGSTRTFVPGLAVPGFLLLHGSLNPDCAQNWGAD